MVQSEESPLTNYHLHQRRRDQLAVTGNWSQKAGTMETRHFMIAGCPGVGKTSLFLTVARGFFPPDESAVPKRFEGWSITVSGPKEDAETAKGEKSKLQRSQLAVQRCHSLGSAPTATTSGSPRATTSQSPSTSAAAAAAAAATTGGAPVNLVLWEDWPRKVQEKRDGAEEDSSESEEPSSDEEDDDEGHHEDLESDFRKLEMERDPVTGRTTLTPRLNPKHRLLHATRSDKSEASTDGCFPPPPPPCQPERPCLSPRPNVIMLCFAQGDVDTFVEAETVIFPELTERYPHVPVILCATKCDEENVNNGDEDGEESAAAAAAAMVVSTSGNGDLAVISEEDSKSCPNTAAASRKFGVTTEMGIAMSRRIGARAYIECSAKTMSGLSPILQEAYRCAVLEAGATGASANNGHGGFGGFPSIIRDSNQTFRRKKNSAPSFLFNSSSSSLSPSPSGSSGTPGVKKKSGKSMMGRKSAASFLRRSKAASLHLINKNSNSDNK